MTVIEVTSCGLSVPKKKAQENLGDLKLNGINQTTVCTDNEGLLRDETAWT